MLSMNSYWCSGFSSPGKWRKEWYRTQAGAPVVIHRAQKEWGALWIIVFHRRVLLFRRRFPSRFLIMEVCLSCQAFFSIFSSPLFALSWQSLIASCSSPSCRRPTSRPIALFVWSMSPASGVPGWSVLWASATWVAKSAFDRMVVNACQMQWRSASWMGQAPLTFYKEDLVQRPFLGKAKILGTPANCVNDNGLETDAN